MRLASAWLTADGNVVIASDTHRSQRRNREACLERLRHVLLLALTEPKTRRPTRMPRGAIERRLEGKRRRAEQKRLRRPPDD